MGHSQHQQMCVGVLLVLGVAIGGVVLGADQSGFLPASVTATVPPWPSGPFVTLRGGGVMAGRLIGISQNGIEIETVAFGRLRLSKEAIYGYYQTATDLFHDSSDSREGALIRLTLANGDQLVARSLSVLAGLCEIQLLSPHPRPDERFTLPLRRVLAIDFSDGTCHSCVSEPAMGEKVVWVALQDGSRFPTVANPVETLQKGSVGEGVVRLQPVSLPPLKILECPTNELVSRMPQESGKWLACQQPALVTGALPRASLSKEVPLLSLPDEQRLISGSNWDGSWPKLRGLTGFSAIAIHSPCCAEYVFDRPVQRFAAVVGIDDSAGQGGSVVLRVTVVSRKGAAGGEALKGEVSNETARTLRPESETEVFHSGLLRGGDPPLLLDLDLGLTRCLRLYVEPARDGNVLDRTLWLDPRVGLFPFDANVSTQEKP